MDRAPAELSGSVLMIGDGDERRVVLRLALVHQKIIIAAAALFTGIVAAGGGAGFIDRAAPRLGVKKLADAAEVFVGLAPHQKFVAVANAGEALFRGREAELVVLGEALDVTLVERDDGVRAAIAGAIEAVVMRHG